MEVKQVRKGTDYKFVFSLQNPDGSPKDLTGTLSIVMSLYKYVWDEPVLQLDEEVTITDAESGEIEIKMDASVIESLEYRLYYIEIDHENALSQKLSVPVYTIHII